MSKKPSIWLRTALMKSAMGRLLFALVESISRRRVKSSRPIRGCGRRDSSGGSTAASGFKSTSGAHGDPELVGLGAIHSFKLSAEHGVIELIEPDEFPRRGDKIEIVPGYSDSTVFLHDYLYGIRDGRIETAWPLLGRGMLQ